MADVIFTPYTEVDPSGYLSVSPATRQIWTAADRGSTTYTYFDYGVDNFGDFTQRFHIRWDDAPHLNVQWALTNDLGNRSTLQGGGKTLLHIDTLNNTVNNFLDIMEINAGTVYFDRHTTTVGAGDRWIEVKRIGSAYTAKIYTDEYITLDDTLTLTLQAGTAATDFRYHQPFISWGSGSGISSGYVDGVTGTGFEEAALGFPFFFETEEHLNNIN